MSIKQLYKNRTHKFFIKLLVSCFLVFYPTECAVAVNISFQDRVNRCNTKLDFLEKELTKSIMIRVALTKHIVNAQSFE